jgi:hypothetical protein
MQKSDLLANAAECERALHATTGADSRSAIERLRNLWLGLACEGHMARHPDMREAISALARLHAEMTAVRATLH